MAENITRCPKCKTSFRISEAHLNSAKGAVRCGSCLNIFNAKEHLISPPKPKVQEHAPQLSESKAAETSKTTQAAHSIAKAIENKTASPSSQEAQNKIDSEHPKQRAEASQTQASQTKASQANSSQNIASQTKATKETAKPKTAEKSKAEKSIEESAKPKPKVEAPAPTNKAKSAEPKQAAQKASKAPTPTKVAPKNTNVAPPEDDDDILISDDMDGNVSTSKYEEDVYSEDFNSLNNTKLGHSRSGQFEVSLFERSQDDDDDDDASDSDESWALDLLNEDSDPAPKAPSQEEIEKEEERSLTQEFEASFNFKLIDEEDSKSNDYPENEEFSFDEADFPSGEDEGYDYDEETFSSEPAVESTPVKQETSRTTREDEDYADAFVDDYDDFDDGYIDEDSTNNFKDEYLDDEHADEDVDYNEPVYSDDEFDVDSQSGQNYLDAIEPEPVEFAYKRHSTFWNSNVLWGSLSVVGALALFIQIAVIKFDTLSLLEPYRSYYKSACKVAGCTLPELVNRNKIRTTNLVVRTHPKEKDALIVDAVLQNTAKFEQSFPTLDLVFTDSREKAVSARRLTPAEYLTGELTGRINMPVKQPVHIAIEISDPGPEAVGYKISIVD